MEEINLTDLLDKKSNGERICQVILNYFFLGKKFIKAYPEWLVDPLTKAKLELDLYNEELKLAVEYQGWFHYEFNPKYHRTMEEFERMKERDILKKEICHNHQVLLIQVSFALNYREPLNIWNFLLSELRKNNIFPPNTDPSSLSISLSPSNTSGSSSSVFADLEDDLFTFPTTKKTKTEDLLIAILNYKAKMGKLLRENQRMRKENYRLMNALKSENNRSSELILIMIELQEKIMGESNH